MSQRRTYRTASVWGALLLTLVAAGCNPHRVNTDVTPVVADNNAYSLLSQGTEQRNRWWESFNDRNLNSLITEALADNLTLRQAGARIEQAIALDKEAASFSYPSVSARISGGHEWNDDDKSEDTFNAGAALSWEIDLWGRIASARNSAKHEILASREELDGAALLLTARIAETYFQIIEQNLQLQLLAHQIESAGKLRELTELRFSYGEASVVDVYQQRQQLASTRTQVPIVKSRLRVLQNRLHVQLGRQPSGSVPELSDRFPILPELPATGVPADLLNNRPDLRELYNSLIAIDYRVGEAVANRFPRLELTGNAGYRDSFSTEGMLYSLLIEAAAPILDWDRRKSEVDRRTALLKESLFNYSLAYLSAVEEVENALWQEVHQKELLESLNEQISIARSNLAETRSRYQQGLTDYLPVLTALQSLQLLERDILSRQRQLISIRILLYRSLGGTDVLEDSHINSAVINHSHATLSGEMKK